MNSTTTTNYAKVLPVLFAFFVMGFCDIVGISTEYVKQDFNLSETLAGFVPSMVFIWFLFLSVPTAFLMNRIGRKKTVQLSNFITITGMIIPFIQYNLITCMVGFAFLGIGNTILQVSLNPLLTNVVNGNSLTSSLTTGQLLKALSSFSGPIIASFAAKYLGSWQYTFPIFAAITVISGAWLMVTNIPGEVEKTQTSSFWAIFALLKNKTILLLFLGIVFVVGVDVGMNTVTPKLLIERCNLHVEDAGLGTSVYFLCRTIGAFAGAILLTKMKDLAYFRIHILAALAGLAIMYFMYSQTGILTMVGFIGFACSSIFAVIFSLAMKTLPEKANDISGLMVMGIVGGAIVTPIMGATTDAIGSQTGSLFVIAIFMAYLIFCSFAAKTVNK